MYLKWCIKNSIKSIFCPSQQALKLGDRNFYSAQILFNGMKSQSLYKMLKCVEKSRKFLNKNFYDFIEKNVDL